MIDYLGMVKEFHEKYGHTINTCHFDGDKYPSFPRELVILREKLITEEAQEFKDWSYEIYDSFGDIPINIIEISDALADLLYVVFGTALSYGIPIDEIFTEVHRSNMTKSMKKDTKSIKGKTVKGPNWEPPKIKEILMKHA